MVLAIHILLLAALLTGYASRADFCEKRDLSTLKQLIILFRHGDRTPIATFPTDIYQEDSWPSGWGQLTAKGIDRQIDLGQWTRQCYETFLDATLRNKRIYIRSTAYDRTMMSAQAHIVGVYPSTRHHVWSQGLNLSFVEMGQLFPIHTVPLSQDDIMLPHLSCTRFHEAIQEAFSSSMVMEIEREESDTLTFLSEQSGLHKTDFLSITRNISDPIIVELHNNRTLVDWLENTTIPNKLVGYMNTMYRITYGHQEIAKLVGGPLLRNIIEQMVNHSLEMSPHYDHVMYSAHDSTLASVLASLGDFNNILPPYTSSIIFELHKVEENSFGVLVFYRNSSDIDPFPVKIPKCSGFLETGCLLPDFVAALATKVSYDRDKECRSRKPVHYSILEQTASSK